MAITTAKQLPLADLTNYLARIPDFARTEDKSLRFQGKPVNVFCIVNNTTTTDYELQTTLDRVETGFAYNVTDDDSSTASALVIGPKSTDKTIAVITGNLVASKTYLIFVIGANRG